MRGDQDGPPGGGLGPQGGQHPRLGGGVQPGRRLVEQQHGTLAVRGEQGPGQGHPAALARGQAAAALTHGLAERHVVQGGGARGRRDGLRGRAGPAEPDV